MINDARSAKFSSANMCLYVAVYQEGNCGYEGFTGKILSISQEFFETPSGFRKIPFHFHSQTQRTASSNSPY